MKTLLDIIHNESDNLFVITRINAKHCNACSNYKISSQPVRVCHAKDYEQCPEVRRQLRAVFFDLQAMGDSLDINSNLRQKVS